MAFSPENEKWILSQIHEAIHPTGWRKVGYFLRAWGVLGLVVTAFVGIVAIAVTMGVTAFNRVEQNAIFRQHTEDRLGRIEESLIGLRALIASSQPTRKQNQDAAKEILAEARQKAIPAISALIVEQAGKSFIEAARTEPKAWDVALDFVAYRSGLAGRDLPKGNFNFSGNTTINPTVVVGEYSVFLSGQMSGGPAILERIGANLPRPCYSAMLKIVGEQNLEHNGPAVLRLDGTRLENVIAVNLSIEYSGGPMILRNVYFVNCTFSSVKPSEGSRQFASTLLASAPSVTFNLGG